MLTGKCVVLWDDVLLPSTVTLKLRSKRFRRAAVRGSMITEKARSNIDRVREQFTNRLVCP
jgi:hypothetical protein